MNEELLDRALAEGETPLEFMIRVMRDQNATPAMRLDAAAKAAPYVHPRLAAMEHSGAIGMAFEDVLDELE